MAGFKRNNNQRGRDRFDPIGYNQRDNYERRYDYYDEPRRYDDYPYGRYPGYDDYERRGDWEARSRSPYDFPARGYDRRSDDMSFRGNEGRAGNTFGGPSSMPGSVKIKVELKKPDKYTKDNAIFVSGLPIEYCRFKQKEILAQLEKWGNIIQNVVFPKNPPSGFDKVGIIVVYETSDQAQKAIKELDGYTFGSDAEAKPESIGNMETEAVPNVSSSKGINCVLKKPDKYTKDNVVLVRDIPQDVCIYDKKNVVSEFEKYGTIIQKVTFAKDPISGYYKGTITVIYENNDQAMAAIKAMDGFVFEEHREPELPKETIIYKEDSTEPNIPLSITESDSENGLRVRNIPSFCRTDDVMRLFESYGRICQDINLIDDPSSDVGTLTCLIIYQNPEDVKTAMEKLNGYRFDKSQVYVPSIPIYVKYNNMSKGRGKNKECSSLQASNIPRSYGIKELEKLFSKYGKLSQKITIPRDKFSGEARGISRISFESVREAKAAKEALDGAKLEVSKEEYYDYYYGTDTARELYERITVKPCTTESHGKTIYLAGIPLYFSEWKANEAVKRCFSKFGTIEKAELPRGKGTGDIRGIGFITFETKEEADLAISTMNDKLVTEAFSSDVPALFQPKQYDYYQQPRMDDSRLNNPYDDYNWDRRGASMNQGALSALSEPSRQGDPQLHGTSDPSLDAPPTNKPLRAADALSFLAAPADPMSFLTLPAAPKTEKTAASSLPSSAPTSSQKDSDYTTVVNALTSLKNVCSYLPILGPSLREALNASIEQNQDAKGVLSFFQAKDTHGLLDLVLVKLENLQKNRSNKDNRQVDLFTDAIKCIGVLQGTIELPKTEEPNTDVNLEPEETSKNSQEDYNNSKGNNYKPEEEYYNKEEDDDDYNNYPDRKFGSFGNFKNYGQQSKQNYGQQSKQNYGNSEGNYGSSQENYGSYGGSQGNYGSSQGNYGSSQGNYGNSQGNYGNSKGNYGNSQGNYGNSEENYGNMETDYSNSDKNYSNTKGYNSNENYNYQENYEEYDENDYRHTDENYRNW